MAATSSIKSAASPSTTPIPIVSLASPITPLVKIDNGIKSPWVPEGKAVKPLWLAAMEVDDALEEEGIIYNPSIHHPSSILPSVCDVRWLLPFIEAPYHVV
jgi:hypothetical protein